MRKFLNATLAACFILVFITPEAVAIPANGAAIVEQAESTSQIEQARVFCYNRYNGRFLHWGSCGRTIRRRVVRPRVYCYNRRTGRFLHWGHC